MSEDTPEIFAAAKVIPVKQEWVAKGNGRLHLVHALDTDDGVTRQGLILRIEAYADLPSSAVMVQLEYPQADRNDHAIDRIDWRPLRTPHKNINKGPAKELRRQIIHGSHRHEFELNWLEEYGRLLSSNLPIARALEREPEDFASVLEFASKCLRISNLNEMVQPPPQWEDAGLFR